MVLFQEEKTDMMCSAATLSYSFTGTGVAKDFDFTDTLKIMAVSKRLQPVTTETASGGAAIVNPAVTMEGELAMYCMEVQPSSIPDSDIEWSIAQGSGNIQFYNTGNKGRSVIVRGMNEGDFKLEVAVAGDDPASPKPYILGKVLPETVTALHFFIIYDANGNPSVTETEIDLWVTELNRIYRQVAMRFTKGSVTHVKDKPHLFHIDNRAQFQELCAYASNTGGLEVYCVDWLYDGVAGRHSRWGLAVTAGAPTYVLAHEIGHACGLTDIWEGTLGNTLISEELVGWQNWSGGTGTGYYPQDLKHADLLKRLLMYRYTGDNRVDIPLGGVKGYDPDSQSPLPLLISVGLTGSTLYVSMNRNPSHY